MADVSFIVPSFNEEKYIKKCLKSIRDQKTNLDYELILSDSKSTDKTLSIAEKYVDKIVSPKKRGISFGRNEGANAAKGRTLIFIDSDTTIPFNYINVVHSVLLNEKIAGLCCAFKFDDNSFFSRMVAKVSNNYLLVKSFNSNGVVLGFNTAVTKKLFQKVGGFPNKPLED